MTDTEQPDQPASAESPLASADASSINELFNRDPLDLSDSDVDAIVQHFQSARRDWETEERRKPAGKRNSKSAPKPKPKASPKMSLGDLGL